MYAYCNNNPVMYVDYDGMVPKWLKTIGKGIVKLVSSFVKSFEVEVGLGQGFGFKIEGVVKIDISRDTIVGIDDGEWITGNVISAEASLLGTVWRIGDEYRHIVEKGGRRISSSGCTWDSPFDMINYPDVENGNVFSFFTFAVNQEGDILLTKPLPSGHFILGGHCSATFNVTEFFERLLK